MDLSKFSRRDFIRSAAMGTAGITLASFPSFALESKAVMAEKPLYRFVVLGDMHYDKLEHHDMTWVQANHPGDVTQIVNYTSISANHTPALLARVREVIDNSDVPVPFVLQLGDLVEGLCGSYELAAKQFEDAAALIEGTKLGVPFLMCKGNHDITGPGAVDAYQKVLLPWLSKQGGQKLTTPHFAARYKGDLFVFFDGYKPDLNWLQKEFARNADARHTFFLLHQPVVPYNARASWVEYYNATQRPMRQRLLDMLGQRRAIVLSGHLHKYGFLEYQTPHGRFTQLAAGSVVSKDFPTAKDERIGVAAYTPDLVNLEPSFDPSTLTERMQFLSQERAFIRQYEYADIPGFAVVDVYASGASCQYYGGLNQTPYRSPSLTPGLAFSEPQVVPSSKQPNKSNSAQPRTY